MKFSIDKKIALLLIIMAAIAVINVVIVYQFLSLQRCDSHIINIAGRQRMLSQKIAKLILSASLGDEVDLQQIPQSLELYNSSLLTLQYGGEVLNLTIPKAPKIMDPIFKKNWEIWMPIEKSAEKVMLNRHNLEAASLVKLGSDNLLNISNEITTDYENYFVKKIVLFKGLLIIMLVSDFVIIIIGWLLTDTHIVKPLKYLSKTAAEIGKGSFNQKIMTSNSNDEIGELANSFNTMLKDLKHTTVSKKYVDNIIASMMNSLIVVYPDGTISQVNQATLNLLGYKEDELIGQPFSMILGNWDELKDDKASIGDLLKTGNFQSEEQSYLSKDGRKVPVLFANSVMLKEDGTFQGVVCVAQDISDIKEAERELRLNEEKFRSITTAANDAIILMDENGIITYCNHAVSSLFGYKTNELIGKDLHQTLAPKKYHGDFKKGFEEFKTSGHGNVIGKTTEFTGINNKGQEFPVEISLASFQSGDKLYALGIIRDITRRKKLEDELKHLATTDRLTGAFNRLKFDEIIALEIARAKRYNSPLSLLMFDIDKFKNVNDVYGHDIGDLVLKTTANLILTNIRKMDYFFRWGGEEFLILATNANLEGALTIAENIRHIIEGHTFDVVKRVTISIGVSRFKEDIMVDTFIKRADEALYRAKENGRNRVEVNI